MDCRQARERTEQLLDGTLDGPALAELRAHLQACAGCRGYVEAAQTVLGALPASLPDEAPAGLVDRIMTGVSQGALPTRDRRLRRRSVWTAAAAAGLVLAVVLFRPTRPRPEPVRHPDLGPIGRSMALVFRGLGRPYEAPHAIVEPVDTWLAQLGRLPDATPDTSVAIPEGDPLGWAAGAGRDLLHELGALGAPMLNPLSLLPVVGDGVADLAAKPPKG